MKVVSVQALARAVFLNMPGSPLSSEELRLAKLWYHDDDVVPSEIARRLRRNKSTITRAVVQELPRGGRGRKRMLSEAQVDATIKCLERLVDEASARKEVTLHQLHRERAVAKLAVER